ncbi:MFS transporter [Niabella hibiscisoli]|uniref:MFS transporter n=1 Tax=Niabella hibiscisoli TaxID=1825928 RepID=UPI001F0F1174|nr:MFS transporter [Niabella hibiscisoli]MCH5717303.1 MFS transporter [Niabella hibiscisoli]
MSTAATIIQPRTFKNVKQLPEANRRIATWISFLLIPLSGLITDIYIPSMPHMAQDLHQPEHNIQLTLTLFLISYGASQFITGSLIDSFGRFRLTLFSLVVFIFSNLVIVNTRQIEMIYAMRIVQGITTGFIVVSKRAFFVDVYEGEKRKHYLSIMSIVWSSAPVIAPFIGGYLEKYFNWQANFYALAVYALIMLVLEWVYSGETLQNRRIFKGGQILKDYRFMLKDKSFAWGIAMCGLSYGATMVFSLSGAFIIEHRLHFSPVVAGYAALLMGLAWMTGGFIGKALLNKPFLPKLKVSNVLQLIFAVGMIGMATFSYNIYTLLSFAFLVHICVGFIFNNYFAFCLGRFPAMAGMASGLTGGGVYIVTSVASYTIVGLLQPQNQQDLGYSYLVTGILSFLILHLLLRKVKAK